MKEYLLQNNKDELVGGPLQKEKVEAASQRA
jgi:hypothetical protein